MIVSLTCSWCHGATITTDTPPVFCVTCGHRADVPRQWCDCGAPGCSVRRDRDPRPAGEILARILARRDAADYFTRIDTPEAEALLCALERGDASKAELDALAAKVVQTVTPPSDDEAK